MKKGLIALVLVASAGLASVAHAQNFKVLLNGQPYGSTSGLYASGSNVTIDVGAIQRRELAASGIAASLLCILI